MTTRTKYRCSCGRVWLVQSRAPSGQAENLACRCGDSIAKSSDGVWSAELESPREHWAPLRKLVFYSGLCLLKLASTLELHLASDSWIRPHRLARWRAINRPVRSTCTITFQKFR